MYLVISATNRANSNTLKVANQVVELLQNHTSESVVLYSLESFEKSLLQSGTGLMQFPESLTSFHDEVFLPTKKLLYVIPEYNGGFSGILKLFVDILSTRKYKENFVGKKAGLIGVATGRAGNLRGMEHFTGVLNYLNTTVFPNRLPISTVDKVLGHEAGFDPDSKKVLDTYLKDFVSWAG